MCEPPRTSGNAVEMPQLRRRRGGQLAGRERDQHQEAEQGRLQRQQREVAVIRDGDRGLATGERRELLPPSARGRRAGFGGTRLRRLRKAAE